MDLSVSLPGITFRYEGLALRAECDEASHLVWLEEFLAPQFEVAPEARPDWTITLDVDHTRFRQLMERGPTGDHFAAFVLDTGLLKVAAWRAPGTVFLDRKFNVFYRIEPGRVEVVARGDRRWARTPMMRVIRELAMSYAVAPANFVLHASCFAIGDDGVVIAGPKSSGKTTLLTHALRAPGSAYVANDRLLVSLAEAQPRVRGIPSIVSVREGTLSFFPQLASDITERRFSFRSTREEAAHPAGPAARPWPDGRWGLTPSQLCALFGVASRPEARPKALVLPRIVDREGTIRLLPISPGDAAPRLAEAVFCAGQPGAVSEVFGPPREASAAADPIALCEQLARAVPCFECEMGRAAYSGADSAERFTGFFGGSPADVASASVATHV